ncbi:MAG: isopentenyl-diphosphate delta-isomerase [Crocinitomicaceae bacterium]|nr:isopentenyl-diphosphate delta-isomerase [Crocinitomicaceae bacterium]|tara:strand:- start:4307 stop:4837 length:531 start_codon:yes stop_codon:yes gene_type:complete
MDNSVVLVDQNDRPIATMDKIEAHQFGFLHRAFSVFIFNSKGEMLIHQRALSKYHCGGLWTNACCSHPRLNESTVVGAKRRLHEELGFTCNIRKVFDFVYKSEVGEGLVEHEFDHVFIGNYNGPVDANPNEIKAWKFANVEALKSDLKLHPDTYTPWFKIAFPLVVEHLEIKRNAA